MAYYLKWLSTTLMNENVQAFLTYATYKMVSHVQKWPFPSLLIIFYQRKSFYV